MAFPRIPFLRLPSLTRYHRTLAVAATSALVAGLTIGTPPRSYAADNGVPQLLGLLGQGGDPTKNLATWTQGLGSVGKLAEPLPLVQATAGALLDYSDLFAKAVTDELASATSFADLQVDKDITIDGNRTGHLKTTVSDEGSGKKLSITVDVAKKVTGQNLHLVSASPKVDLTVTDGINVDLASRLSLSVVWTGATDDKVYVVSGASGPRLDLDVKGTVDAAKAKAAAGILGVTLSSPSLDIRAYFAGTVSDPDNDGRLSFGQELGQPGSLEGLVSVGLDTQGSQPISDTNPGTRGSVTGQFTIGAANTFDGAALPGGLTLPSDINTTIGVNWPDVGVGGPTVTAPGLADTVGKFQNLSMGDLASGLSQIVVALTGIQKKQLDNNKGDIDLPFMRGKLSDAVQVGKKLADFLKANSIQDPNNPLVSSPKYSSLQELLSLLAKTSGIQVSNLGWDATSSKLSMKLQLSDSSGEVDLDAASALLSGPTATYGDKSLSVSGTPFQGQNFTGRIVTAGTAVGTIASNDANSLTLAAPWQGGTPVGGTPYVITGGEPHLGAASFANLLTTGDKRGILNANADQTFAKVTPSVAATLTVVLDLQDPHTGNACVGFEGITKPCPFDVDNGGLAVHVEQLPLNTDRVMLRTGNDGDGKPYTGFAADFPIASDVDFTANAGFFKVRLKGSLKVCHASLDDKCAGTPSGKMLTVAFKSTGDAQHDVRMSTLFKTLADSPTSLLDVSLAARAYAKVDVSVPGASSFPSSAGFTATWSDVSDPTKLNVDVANLSDVFALDYKAGDPKALFGLLIKNLQTLAAEVAQANSNAGSGVLDKEIPGLGRSLKDLFGGDESNSGIDVEYGADTLVDKSRTTPDRAFSNALIGRTVIVGTRVGVVKAVPDGKTLQMAEAWETAAPAKGTPYSMRSALADAIDRLLLAPPDNLQDATKLLNQALGTDAVKFKYLPGTTPSLVLAVDWARNYQVGAPVKLGLGAAGTFASVSTSAQASVGVDGKVNVGLVVPLKDGAGPSDAAGLKVLEDSKLSLKVHSELKGVVEGILGPLSIALGKPGGGDDAVAQVDLSALLSKSGAQQDTPVSFADFLSGASMTFNADSGKADCGEGLNTPLMVCAKLPVYINGASAGPINLRVPKSTAPADLTDLDDALADDGGKKELEVPDLAAFLNGALDFGNFGDGIDAYLARIEQAFQLASFQGKLPLVGDDLQQGADFIGTLRKTMNDTWAQLGGAPPKTTEEFTAFINDKLAKALKDAGIGVGVKVTSDCKAFLEPTTITSVVPDKKAVPDDEANKPTNGTFTYKVVAFQGDGNGYANDTLPSGDKTVDNWTNFYAGSSNTVKWSAVDGATGYKVLRKLPAGSAFKLVQKVTSGATVEWKDTNAADTGDVYDFTKVTAKPKRNPCPAGAGDDFFIDLDLAKGKLAADGCTNPGAETDALKNCLSHTVPLDIGIPGLAVSAGDAEDKIKFDLGYSLHLRIGLNKKDGVFIATHDAWDSGKASPELQVGLDLNLPSTMQAELAFIDIDVKKNGTDPEFAGLFQLDVSSSGSELHCFAGEPAANCTGNDDAKLKFAELGSLPIGQLLPFRLKATAKIDWHLAATADSALPGIAADFKLDWSIDNKPTTQFGAPTIKFDKVGITAGDFFKEMLGPIVENIKKVTGPVQPVVDTLYAPIPVLSDLSRMAGGGDVTLITLAKAYSTLSGGPSLDFVDTIKAISDFITRLPTDCNANCFIELGSFELVGQKALDTSNSPSTAATMFDTGKTTEKDPSAIKSALNTADPHGPDLFSTDSDPKTKSDVEKSGFKFPILDDPLQAFTVLMGGDVDLVTFDSGPLEIGFSWRQDFGPVYAPPPVVITLAGAASATLHIRAGLDTYGLRKTVELIREGKGPDALTFLDGLYFSTVDEAGNPVPVVTLTGEIAAGAAVTALIVKVGIEGGLRLTIGFYWNDPNDDAKFRISEVGQAILNNPVCLFRMKGELSLFLRLVITIGIGPFSTSFDIELANIKLLDFSVEPDCEPEPPKLGKDEGDTLVVYAGKFGDAGHRGADWDKSKFEKDTVKVIALHYAQTGADPEGDDPAFDGVAVEALGYHQEFLNTGLKRVVVDGTGSDKPLIATFIGDGEKKGEEDEAGAGKKPTVFELDAVVIGSDKDDKINTGTGSSYVDGRDGKDNIVTHEDPSKSARIAGGGNDDVISTLNGDDFVAGDGTLGSVTRTVAGLAVFDWAQAQAQDPTTASTTNGTPGGDTIAVGLGKNRARGNGGDDKIGVAADQPQNPDHPNPPLKAKKNVLIGDGGSDKITGGSNSDEIFTSTETKFADATANPIVGVDDDGPDDAATKNVVDTGAGADTVWGSKAPDFVTSHSVPGQTVRIYGGAENDVLIGGYGTDEVYGGPGQDYVIAEPSDVSDPDGDEKVGMFNYGPKRVVTKLPFPAGMTSSTKLLVGGLGNDHIIGGDGTATIFGDKRIDAEKCTAGNPVESDAVGESTKASTGDGNDLILGGAGVDTVSAGGAADIAKTFANLDLVCGQEGLDTLYGGNDADKVWGGSDADLEYGEAGEDHVFGNGGEDTEYGGLDGDVLEGNNGSDWISGGALADKIYGGTRAEGRNDTDDLGPAGAPKGDDLYGDSGLDELVGDNGSMTPAYPFDLAGSVAKAGAGDRLHGGADDDKAYGGLGDDKVNGNSEGDLLEGNNGSDTVHGNEDDDRIIGGSSQEASTGVGRPDTGDWLYGDAGPDLVTGDNAQLTIAATAADATRVTLGRGFDGLHKVTLLDLGFNPTAQTSGADYIEGGDDQDVVYAQDGPDRAKGNAGEDYVEGGPAVDWLEGDDGDDDVVGGSSTPTGGSGDATAGQPDTEDALNGGPGDDVVLGDNGRVLRLLDGDTATKATLRVGSTAGDVMTPRIATSYDLRNGGSLMTPPAAGAYGADRVSGGSGVDVIYGQDGGDFVSGGAHGDYIEGNGAGDVIRGDLALDAAGHTTVAALADPGWPGAASSAADVTGTTTPDGQDDLIGGSSTAGFRDAADQVEGNGADDVTLGDNGTLLRTLQGDPGSKTEKVYTDRYPDGAVPADATRSRVHDPDRGDVSTRFCSKAQSTCDLQGAWGADTLWGDAGDDGMWGQDGNDTMYGGTEDDDLYGELGNDVMFGEAGEDAMIGDRGGVVNEHLSDGDTPASFTVTLSQVPQETFTGFRRGLYDRRFDLLHDVDGDEWIGGSTAAAMPHDGISEGGRDKMRGGPDADNVHAGFGDDLANGDSGGDKVFGDDGEDVLWGGKGCDPVLNASTADCLNSVGAFDPSARGTNDRFVDHIFGGVGEVAGGVSNISGSDVLDWNPRGTYTPGTGCATGDWPVQGGTKQAPVSIDPCVWFEMTSKDDADTTNNQFHHGTDWIYGGWDRDVMQGNVSQNGPNPGDRLIDWTGAYNLYTHCNASYGGYNDLRLLAPALLDFLNGLAWVDGAGRAATDVTTKGTSAYRELALTYNPDFKDHGNGTAYPSTPGHFEDPTACEG